MAETGGAPAEEEGAGEQQGSADFGVGVDGHVSKAAVTLHKPGLVRPGARALQVSRHGAHACAHKWQTRRGGTPSAVSKENEVLLKD